MNKEDKKIFEWVEENLNKDKLFNVVQNLYISNEIFLTWKERPEGLKNNIFATLYKDKIEKVMKFMSVKE